MRLATNDEFFRSAARVGVRLDTRYEPPQTLTYGQETILEIQLPSDVPTQAKIIASVVSTLPTCDGMWMYRRGGSWDLEQLSQRGYRQSLAGSIRVVLRALGFPTGPGTMYLEPQDRDILAALCFLNLSLAWGTQHDLFVVPTSGAHILWFDHDGTACVVSPNMKQTNAIIAEFEAVKMAVTRRLER